MHEFQRVQDKTRADHWDKCLDLADDLIERITGVDTLARFADKMTKAGRKVP